MHTIRFRPPLSLSFNQSSLFDDTFERNPPLISSPLSPKCGCSCCCCYYAANFSMCNRFTAVNPSYLCKGLSQSNLIQWSLCKRLIFHGRIRQSCGNTSGVSSFTDLDRNYYYEKLRVFKEGTKQSQRGFGYKKKKQLLTNVSDDYVNDVDIMLSLLTNEVGLEYIDVEKRKKINKEKKTVGSGVVKRDFKCDEVVKIKSLKKSENLDLRKEDSSGELVSDKYFEVKSDGYVGQTSSIDNKNDLRKDCKSCIDEFMGKIDKQQESFQGQEELLEKKDTVKGNRELVGVNQNWRKKSEKKLNEEFSQHKSNVSVNIEPRKQLSHEVDKISDESGSRMKYRRFTEMSDKDKSINKSTSSTEKKSKSISEVSENRIEHSTEVNDQIIDIREEKHLKKDEKSQQILKISNTHFTKCENTSISQRKSEPMVTITTSFEDNKEGGSGNCGKKDGGSRHSSQGSGPKGPSDEMWHVTDASTQEPSEPDEPGNISRSSENGELVKTSSRSFWTIIGDVVRLHLISPRSGSHTPNSRGAKGSSYLSTSSETWFSSHEPDDSNEENVKKRIIKGLDSPLTERPSRNTSLPIIKESSFSMKRSPGIKKMAKTDPNLLTELKSRKHVHKDLKDNFDEWEEAYNLENKQRKEDEMFMREALLEAKKAADAREVPVGAVLVKDGKIIARGYNLVEELRDSTAHAEMICIRNASTNLHSWRLPYATLYVTLEPCPMCAGAILQAGIHRVVWGAPNKLLGTDGSWIRLFCDGDGGSGSMPTDKLPAPVHPFHPNMAVRRGVLAAECAEVMQHFFQLRRKKKTEPPTPPLSVNVSHHHHGHSNFSSKIHYALKIIFCL